MSHGSRRNPSDSSSSMLSASPPSTLSLDIAKFIQPRAMDSGYLSTSPGSPASPHTPPSARPDWELSRLYADWRVADDASRRLREEEGALHELGGRVEAARKLRDAQSSASVPKRKASSLSINMSVFRRARRSDPGPVAGPSSLAPQYSAPLTNSPQPSNSSFSSSGSSTRSAHTLEELEAQLATLKEKVASTRSVAAQFEGCYDALRAVLDVGRPVSWRSSQGSGYGQPQDKYTRARRTVAAREEAYMNSKATTQAVSRACLAIQSAHYHYRNGMELLDVVCNPKKSRWEAIMGDEQSRQDTYREAARCAEKAQMCFNECIRALSGHMDLLTKTAVEDSAELQRAGLLQALQLYTLMYGGKVLAMGITQQVQIMMQKQDAVYERLTSFAVWVQDCKVHCETVERDTRETRDEARRNLVALWVRADDDIRIEELSASASALSMS